MARSTAAVDLKATRHGKRLRQREGELSERHWLDRAPIQGQPAGVPRAFIGRVGYVREDSEELCADADGHQIPSAPATMLTQMRGNSHLLVLKELRQQRQVHASLKLVPAVERSELCWTLLTRAFLELEHELRTEGAMHTYCYRRQTEVGLDALGAPGQRSACKGLMRGVMVTGHEDGCSIWQLEHAGEECARPEGRAH